METSSERKTWGEREGVTLDLLRKFTKPGCPRFGEVQQLWSYRGDLTESGDRHMRAVMVKEASEHLHWDAAVSNGGVLVVVPRWKFSGERGSGLGLPAPYWWAMESMESEEPEAGAGIRGATQEEIESVVPDTQTLLSELPGLEYMCIAKVSYFSSDKPGRKQWMTAPQDVRFFRFSAGYGCVAIAAQ